MAVNLSTAQLDKLLIFQNCLVPFKHLKGNTASAYGTVQTQVCQVNVVAC
jgi:hypothetical protein